MLLKHPKRKLAKRFEYYLKRDKKLCQVAQAVQKDLSVSGLTAHNWEHTWRDTLNAIVIGEAEKADMSIVLPAILMHDIGFLWGATGKTHGEVGANKISLFLRKHNIKYEKKAILHMAECIRTHKGSMHGHKPATLEAKVVADADLLEKFGPMAIYQNVRTFTEFNLDIETIIRKGLETQTLTLETKTGKKLAEHGRAFVLKYYKDLSKAYEVYRK